MDFGLGLILSFTDKASAGIQGAIVSLNNLQQAAENSDSKLDALGNALTSLGSLGAGMTAMITAPITAFMGKIVQYGVARASFVEDMHLAFSSLMGDAQEASNYMQSLMNFAKTTPYTYESITSAAQLLISYGYKTETILSGIDKDMNGILDAADETGSHFGGILQAIGDWAGATGRGESAMSQVAEIIGKINAEGKISTMRLQQLQLAGIQASDIIGNMYDMSTDKAAEFIKTMDVDTFISDLVKGIEEGTDGINGMTGAMANQMMNLKNTWTGAKDTFVSSLKTAGLSLMGAYVDEHGVSRYEFLEGLTSALNNISSAVKMIPSILQPLMDTIQSLMTKGSELVLKFTTAWNNLPQPMKTAIGKVLAVLTLLGPALLVISKVGGGVIKMFDTLQKLMGRMSPKMMKFAGTMSLVAIMWKSDFLGMRTSVTWFVNSVRDSFNKAKDAVSGDVNHMRDIISGLDKNNFFDNLSLGIMKFMVLFQALKEGWNDFTLSEDTFLKAKELGILPLIEAIFDLKYRFGFFKQGFIDGWNEIKEKVVSAIQTITEKLKGTFLGDILDKITGFFQKLSNNDPDSWYSAGKIFSRVATGLIALWGAVKLFKGVASIFGKGKSIGSAITNLLGLKKGDDTSALTQSGGGFLSNPAKVAKTMGSIAIILGGATLLITALGAFMKIPYMKEFMSGGFNVIAKLFENLLPIATSIGVLGLLAKAFEVMKISPTTALKGIADFAILLGGLEVLITAMGALNSIPMFDDFLNNGIDVTHRLFGVLKEMFDYEVLGSIALIALFGNVPVQTAALGLANFAIILGGLDVLVTALGALNSIPGFSDFLNNGIEVTNKLFDVLRSMFDLQVLGSIAAIAAFSLVPVPVTLMGLANLALILGGITAVVSAFAALSMIDGFDDFISRGGDTLANLFGQLGKIVGTAIAEFGSAVTNTLPDIGTNIAGFAENVKPFFEMTQDTDFSSVSGFMGALSEMFLVLTGEKIVSFFTGGVDLPAVGTQLAEFATAAEPFFTSVSTMGDSAFENASKMFAALDGLNNYSFKDGGLAQLFTGSLNIGYVGTQLAEFATGAEPFFTAVSGLPENSFTNADKMFGALEGLNNYSFKSGGLAQLFTGTLDLTSIGQQLSDYATNGKAFFDTVATMPDTGFDNATKMFAALEGLNNYSFKTGGLAQLFTGSLDLSSIGTQLSDFATNSSTFFTTAGSVDATSIESAVKIFDALGDLNAYDFKSGGLAQLFTGSFDISSVGSQLSDFATDVSAMPDFSKLTEFTTSLSGFGSAVSTASSNVTSGMTSITTSVTGLESAISTKFGTMSTTVTTKMEAIKTSITTAMSGISTMNTTITTATSSMRSSVTTNFTAIRTTISSMMTSAQSSVTSSLNAMKTAFANTRFSIPQHHISVPHFSVSGSLNATSNPPSVPNFSVSWYKKGGIFDQPSIIGVGEQGREAVMPLDRNTSWIGMLAQQIGSEIESVNLKPISTQPLTRGYDDNNRYIASGGNNTNTYEGDTDNSIVFEAGAIQLNVQNASDEEALRMAKKIMALIKRQDELDRMTSYA